MAKPKVLFHNCQISLLLIILLTERFLMLSVYTYKFQHLQDLTDDLGGRDAKHPIPSKSFYAFQNPLVRNTLYIPVPIESILYI